MSAHGMGTRRRFTGERGIAIIMTALLLLPLMAFAAFGVDLASWYSRISYLQKSADAAALAGTVWMPNLPDAIDEACASLQQNGISGAPSCGSGDFEVTVERGSTATGLRVSVTDPDATRYFSGVLFDQEQRLTRSAEAEYDLAIPLGSPLNYFGGDARRVPGHETNPFLDPLRKFYSTHSPGFWPIIEGPRIRAHNGDAYSSRCWDGTSCAVKNRMYLEPTNVDRGFWYVVKIPPGLTGSVNLRVFDASYVPDPNPNDPPPNPWNPPDPNYSVAGDRSIPADGGGDFPTQFQVWKQTNPLQFRSRTPLFTEPATNAEGSCNWRIAAQGASSPFKDKWQSLCTLTGVSPGETYLINVQTLGTSGAGINGYALDALANGGVGVQTHLHAFASMAIQNLSDCDPSVPTSCDPSTLYLAEVGPQFAGRTLVVELWDPGDVPSGIASMFPMMPDPSGNPGPSNPPRPVTFVPADICKYTADSNPNDPIPGTTGDEITTPADSDTPLICGIETATASQSGLFNGEWLRIRIDIPNDYTCTPGLDPETQGGSCWWGMRYEFDGEVSDVTTWQARIEGNPVRLTQ